MSTEKNSYYKGKKKKHSLSRKIFKASVEKFKEVAEELHKAIKEEKKEAAA